MNRRATCAPGASELMVALIRGTPGANAVNSTLIGPLDVFSMSASTIRSPLRSPMLASLISISGSPTDMNR